MDLNLLLIPWFVMIFTDIKILKLKTIIFDYFLIEGVNSYFRVCFVLFDYFYPYLIKTKDNHSFM